MLLIIRRAESESGGRRKGRQDIDTAGNQAIDRRSRRPFPPLSPSLSIVSQKEKPSLPPGRPPLPSLFPSLLALWLVVVCFSLLLPELADANFKDKYSRRGHAVKRRCHQCNMPNGCSSGSCVGDVCVKSVAARLSTTVYVSKGCENYTEHSSLPHRFEEGCRPEWVFGVESLICYCHDANYCNSSGRSITPLLPLPLLLLLRYLP